MYKTVILYHFKCMDGSGARYAAWKKFGDDALYLPAQYGQDLPEFEKGPDVTVYLLDFSASREALESLRSVCKRVRVIDHHVTAQEALQDDPDAFFDMSKSGAVLAWEEFHPNDPIPMLLQYIQDRDLWKFELDNTQQIHAGLGTLRGNMQVWNNYVEQPISEHVDDMLELLAVKGQLLLDRDRDTVSDKVPSMVKVIDFLGYKAGIINTAELVSEVGDAICRDKTLNVDLALMWVTTKDGGVVISMRSLPGSNVDVATICKKYGGGGHFHSSGMRVTFETLQMILCGNEK